MPETPTNLYVSKSQIDAANLLKMDGKPNVVTSIEEAMSILTATPDAGTTIVIEEGAINNINEAIQTALDENGITSKSIQVWSKGSLPKVKVIELARCSYTDDFAKRLNSGEVPLSTDADGKGAETLIRNAVGAATNQAAKIEG